MKRLLLTSIGLLTLVILSHAATVKLAWDPSPSAETNSISYLIYTGTHSNVWNVATNNVGTNLTATVTNLALGQTYSFRVTAMDTNSLESDFSNTVVWPVPGRPGAPTNLKITVTVVVEIP